MKNNSPVKLFLILEKTKAVIWTNKTMDENTNIMWVDSTWYKLFNKIIKYESSFHNTWLTEQSALDNLFNSTFYNKISRLTLYNVYYSYYLKSRTILLCNTVNNIDSVDRLFKNANWLERESSEMYGVEFLGKSDSRKLLLDYSKIESPMLKDFSSEGVKDVFYDILDNQVTLLSGDTVEL